MQKRKTQKADDTKFKTDEKVWVRNYHGPPHWLPGIIVQKIGTCNYFVKVKGQIWKRHIDQLRLHHVIDKLTLTENIGYFQPVNRMKVP